MTLDHAYYKFASMDCTRGLWKEQTEISTDVSVCGCVSSEDSSGAIPRSSRSAAFFVVRGAIQVRPHRTRDTASRLVTRSHRVRAVT